MANFRIETVFDSKTGRYFVEAYQEGKETPFIIGKPIYMSHEHAMADSIEIFKSSMPDQPITAWREQ